VTTLIVGASSGLGRALATELASRGHELLLVSSDARDLDAIAADLTLRHGVRIHVLALELAHEVDAGVHLARALDALPALDALLLPAGLSVTDDDFSLDPARIGQLLAINLHAPLAIVHALLPRLLMSHGVIVLFGSIAAVRGRGRNVAYAAAKRGLESMQESLRHHYTPQQLRVQLYRLGFLATNLTHGMSLPTPATDPAHIARIVAARLKRGSARWYLPRRFALIGLIIHYLPWPLYRRMRG
jgi:short-subunit dehydrogenase